MIKLFPSYLYFPSCLSYFDSSTKDLYVMKEFSVVLKCLTFCRFFFFWFVQLAELLRPEENFLLLFRTEELRSSVEFMEVRDSNFKIRSLNILQVLIAPFTSILPHFMNIHRREPNVTLLMFTHRCTVLRKRKKMISDTLCSVMTNSKLF